MLELADQPYRYEAIREDCIRSIHRLTPAAFWQQVNTILERADALEADAQLVRRMLRKRDRRAAARVGSAAWPGGVGQELGQPAAQP